MSDARDDDLKRRLLAASKELLARGLTEATAGNLSVRLPGDRAAMTPSSVAYETMTVDDLAVVDFGGKVLEGERPPTSEKALHLACLRDHDDIGAVIHCHPVFATMFAVVRQPIPCVIEEFDIYVGGDVPVADYRLTGSDELGEEVARHVGDRGAVLMANHGLLTVGKDPEQALKVASLVERTAQVIWGARALGEVVPLPQATRERFAPLYKLMRRP